MPDKNIEKITVHLDNQNYYTKPQKTEVKLISNRICNSIIELTIQELAEKLINGYTLLPCIMKDNKRNKKNFIESSLILLDFDNSQKINGEYIKIDNYISYNEIQEHSFIKENACFIYRTFSNTDEINRFRVVFKLQYPIKNKNQYEILVKKLLNVFPTADISCKDVTRLFYGGSEYTEISFSNTLNINSLLNTEQNKIEHTKESALSAIKLNQSNLNFTNRYLFDISYNENNITQLIKERNIEEYRNYLLNFEFEILSNFQTKKDIVYFINAIDTRILLGLDVELGENFCCVLTQDDNPSAGIYKIPNANMFVYKRFSENELSLSNIDVFKALLHTNSKDKVLDFFIRVFQLEMEIPINLIHTNKIIKQFLEHINDAEKLKTTPYMYKVLNVHKGKITSLLEYFIQNPLYNRDKNEVEYICAKSAKTLNEILFGETSESKRKKFNTLINLLSYLNIIEKLDESEYPSIFYLLRTIQFEKHFKAITSILRLYVNSNITFELFIKNLENKCSFLKENGYSFRGFTQDFITMFDSITESNKVFKQTKNKKVSTQITQMHTDLLNILYDYFIDKNNQYLLESDLKNILYNEFHYSKTAVKINYSKTLGLVLNTLSLQKKKASKIIKDEFDIDADSYPFVIFRM